MEVPRGHHPEGGTMGMGPDPLEVLRKSTQQLGVRSIYTRRLKLHWMVDKMPEWGWGTKDGAVTGGQKVVLKAHTVPAGAGTNPFPGAGEQFLVEFGALSPCVALGQSLPLCWPQFPRMSYLEVSRDLGRWAVSSQWDLQRVLGFSLSESTTIGRESWVKGWWVTMMVACWHQWVTGWFWQLSHHRSGSR